MHVIFRTHGRPRSNAADLAMVLSREVERILDVDNGDMVAILPEGEDVIRIAKCDDTTRQGIRPIVDSLPGITARHRHAETNAVRWTMTGLGRGHNVKADVTVDDEHSEFPISILIELPEWLPMSTVLHGNGPGFIKKWNKDLPPITEEERDRLITDFIKAKGGRESIYCGRGGFPGEESAESPAPYDWRTV